MIYRSMLCSVIVLGCAAASCAAIARAGPAQFTSADFVRIAPPADRGCIFGDAAKTATPEQKIDYCTTAMAEFERLKSKSANPAERAGLTYLIASYDFVRAGSYLKVDDAGFARVCGSVERAYALVAPLDITLFDTAMAKSLTISQAAISRTTVVCRANISTPAGAPATLP